MNQRRMITALLIGGATAGCTTSVSTAADEFIEEQAVWAQLSCECWPEDYIPGGEALAPDEVEAACETAIQNIESERTRRCFRRVRARYVESTPGSLECALRLLSDRTQCVEVTCDMEWRCSEIRGTHTCFGENTEAYLEDMSACQETD